MSAESAKTGGKALNKNDMGLEHLRKIYSGFLLENFSAVVEAMGRKDFSATLLSKTSHELDLIKWIVQCLSDYLHQYESNESTAEALLLWAEAFRDYLDRSLNDDIKSLYNVPLRLLIDALKQLDDGEIPKIFVREGRAGRPPDSSKKFNLKADCTALSFELYEFGDINKTDRRRSWTAIDARIVGLAAARAKLVGVELTEETIKGWRRAIREAPDSPLAKQVALVRELIKRARKTAGPDFLNRVLEEQIGDSSQ